MPDPGTSETLFPQETPADTSLSQVSGEVDGRILTGVGADESVLQEIAETRTPELPTEPSTEKPKPTRGQRRFSELTSERDKARNEAKAHADRISALEAELAAAKATPAPAVVQEPVPTPPPVPPTPSTLRSRPSVNEIGTKYADWDAYQTDDTAWIHELTAQTRAEIDAQFRQRDEAERASRALTQTMNDAWSQGRASYPDFDAVVNSSQVPIPVPIQQAILSRADRHDILYALGKSPQIAAEVAKIDNYLDLGMTLGRLVASAEPAVAPASTRSVRTSQAPPPIQPVGSGSKTTSPSLEDLATRDDFAAYKARRHADLGIAGHR